MFVRPRTRLFQPVSPTGGRRVSRDVTRPAPIGGWNARDPRNQMDPRECDDLRNWFPRRANIVSRPGYVAHCDTASATPIRRIFEYEYETTHKLLASNGGAIRDVTTSTPSSLGSGFGSDQWVDTVFNGRMFFANGTDDMQVYDGTTLGASTFTGVALDAISYVHTHSSRIYVIEKDTQKFYYGGVGSISGALTAFDLSLVGSFGGNLKILFSISRDGGAGPDDYFVAVFESGDAIVYSGTNPGDANNWSKVGIFKIGRPLSRLGLIAWADDTIILTDRGYESVKDSMPVGDALRASKVVSDKIRNAVETSINRVGVDDRWQIALYPKKQMLIVHIPGSSEAITTQHVRNIDTGAWCYFNDIGSTAWGRFGEKVYCGTSDGRVLWFDGADDDDGTAIEVNCLTAYDSLGRPSVRKQHKLLRLVFETEATPTVYVSIATDLNPIAVGAQVAFSGSNVETYWDEADWNDEPYWSDDRVAAQGWAKAPASGYSSALRLYALVSASKLQWNSTTFVYEEGGNL